MPPLLATNLLVLGIPLGVLAIYIVLSILTTRYFKRQLKDAE